MTLTGYTDRQTYRAGDRVECMLSATAGSAMLDLVRLLHGDTNPAGPGHKSEVVDAWPARRIDLREQDTTTGSCVVVPDLDVPDGDLSISMLLQPTLPEVGRPQGVLTLVDDAQAPVLGVELTAAGTFAVRDGDGALVCEVVVPHRRERWFLVELDLVADTARLRCTPDPAAGDDRAATIPIEDVAAGEGPVTRRAPVRGVVIGARSCARTGRRWQPDTVFNGKVEHPVLRTPDEVLGDWRFELAPESDRCVDTSGNGYDGVVVGAPTRAVRGHAWTGRVVDATVAPEQYGSIHLHEDDLADAGWDVSVSIDLPEDLPSGVYALRLDDGAQVDHVPFVVTPRPGTAHARVALVLPTFTYIAYGNERMIDRLDFEGEQQTDHPVVPGFHDRELARHPEWGLSLYDVHSDGSTCVYSTSLRPIPNLRPDYRSWLQDAPRHLAADLYVVDWLTETGFAFDVLTDHDLAERGAAALDGYDVVLTGSHPEYVSERMLDAYAALPATGRHLLYLGGNGFYWVTSQDPERPSIIEVRRGPVGTRPSEGAPGEGTHSTTGEPGGLWRQRDRSPNRLTGIGMTAQGWDAKAPGFRRMPDASSEAAAFVFAGIGEDEVIGDFGLIMDGASGDEIDRFDLDRGSPGHTLVLARSTGHSDYYQLAGEDVLASRPGLGGTQCPEVRSDMVLVEDPSGGAVFSVGSICFSGSLSHDGYRNNVSRLVQNVVDEFLARGERRRTGGAARTTAA